MRSRSALVAAVLGGVLIAGFSSEPLAGDAVHAAHPVVRAAPARPCSGPARLAAGEGVAAWRLGAVRFVSRDAGVGLTAAQIPCARSLGKNMGVEETEQAQPVRLAVTGDGGRHWVITGRALPGPVDVYGVQVAAVAGRMIWVISPVGQLYATRDDGMTWARQPAPAPVVATGTAGGWLWALSCTPVPRMACRPAVERMRLPGGAWSRTRPVIAGAFQMASLTVVSGSEAVVAVRGPYAALVSTDDGGQHWQVRPAPADPGYWCSAADNPRWFITSGPRDWWLLCLGGAAAGSDDKALLRSTDAGRSWTVTATASLMNPRRASLPLQDGGDMAVSPAGWLAIATPNTLDVSSDGGTRWSRVAAVDPGGSFGQFDVLSGTAAWLLAPGAGLWQTTDGTSWQAVGGTGPGIPDPQYGAGPVSSARLLG